MHLAITPVVLENLSEMVPKSSQNLSKIDLGGGLGATWEPHLRRGDPKTSFLTISAPFWDPISLGSFWASIFDVFLIRLPDGVFTDLGSIWALFWDPFLGLVGSCLGNST